MGWRWRRPINLGCLLLFKYLGFFCEGLALLLSPIGLAPSCSALHLIVPLGLSYYTFQKVGYILDCYQGRVKPCRQPVDFALFVSFFPQLLCGPIERAGTLLPQLQGLRGLDGAACSRALYLLTYGLFKKVVMADTLADFVDRVFAAPAPSGAEVLLACYAWSLQMYCDFSGYTDLARGSAALFGVQLSANFNLPFFSARPREFFRRWHITLSTWITRHVHYPLLFWLGGRLQGRWGLSARGALLLGNVLAGLATMTLFSFWHGASFNFLVMGPYLYGMFALYDGVAGLLTRATAGWLPRWAELLARPLNRLVVLHLLVSIFVMVRPTSFPQLQRMVAGLAGGFDFRAMGTSEWWYVGLGLILFFTHEFFQYRGGDELYVTRWGFYRQVPVYCCLFFFALQAGASFSQRFIYIQF